MLPPTGSSPAEKFKCVEQDLQTFLSWILIYKSHMYTYVKMCCCNGDVKRVPGGVVCTPEDCQVRVFGSSGSVDRPSDRLSVRTIPLSGSMERCSWYILFSSQE